MKFYEVIKCAGINGEYRLPDTNLLRQHTPSAYEAVSP